MNIPPPSQRQARILWISATSLAIAVLLGLLGLLAWGVGWVIQKLSTVLLPLAVAGILAFLLDPVVGWLVQKGHSRTRSIFMVFTVAILVFLGFIGAVVPPLVSQTADLYRSLDLQTKLQQSASWIENQMAPGTGSKAPSGSNAATNRVQSAETTPQKEEEASGSGSGSGSESASQDNQKEPKEGEKEEEPWWAFLPLDEWTRGIKDTLIKSGKNLLPSIGRWLIDQVAKVASWAGLLIGLALAPVYLFYFLKEKQGIEKSWTDYLPIRESRFKEETVFVLGAINEHLIVFFRGQVLVALCLGALLTAGFWIVGLKFALLLGVVAGVLSIVPYLGVMLSLLPALTLAAMQKEPVWWLTLFQGDDPSRLTQAWMLPLLVLGVFILAQAAEGLVISPKIIGDRVGLHPLTIIISVMIGTTLMGGIIGGVLAIPLTAALKVLMFRYVWKRPTSKLDAMEAAQAKKTEQAS